MINLYLNYDGFIEHSSLIDVPTKFDAYPPIAHLLAERMSEMWAILHKHVFVPEHSGLINDLNCSFVNCWRRISLLVLNIRTTFEVV